MLLKFDHVLSVKLWSIYELIGKGCCLKVIEKEILKCDVRCGNCHRLKTAKQFACRRLLMSLLA